MKTNYPYRPAAILTGVAALIMTFHAASPALAQDNKPQTVTATVTASPSKDKKEQKITVVAKSGSKDANGKVKVHIIKDENGKKTEIDTVISAKGGTDSEEIEALVEKVHAQMKDVEGRMKEVELYMANMDDSLQNDSSGHHKYMFKFNGGPGCSKIRLQECPHAFNYDYELPEIPDFSEGSDEFFDNRGHSPRVFSMPEKGESLSDVLGNIPMSRVKSYKIIDKKGGKRIVIDIEDGPFFDGGKQVIYINGGGHQGKPPRGEKHQKDMKVIIRSDNGQGESEGQESPAPKAEPPKPPADSPKI